MAFYRKHIFVGVVTVSLVTLLVLLGGLNTDVITSFSVIEDIKPSAMLRNYEGSLRGKDDLNVNNSTADTVRVPPMDYEFVISHYNENIDWLKPYADHAHVYHKGSDTRAPFKLYAWERLQNVGRESHTYLHHIITNYDQLSNVTIFLQGGIGHHGACLPKKPLHFISLAKNGIPCKKTSIVWKNMGRIPFREAFQNMTKYKHFVRANITYGEFYEDLMGSKPPARGVQFCYSGCFAATKEMIWKHPVEFYKRGISYVSSNSSPEEGHYFERLWYVMLKTL